MREERNVAHRYVRDENGVLFRHHLASRQCCQLLAISGGVFSFWSGFGGVSFKKIGVNRGAAAVGQGGGCRQGAAGTGSLRRMGAELVGGLGSLGKLVGGCREAVSAVIVLGWLRVTLARTESKYAMEWE